MPVSVSRKVPLRRSVSFWTSLKRGSVTARMAAMPQSRMTTAPAVTKVSSPLDWAMRTIAMPAMRGAPTPRRRMSTIEETTCWTSLVVRVKSEPAVNAPAVRSESDKTCENTSPLSRRPRPVEMEAERKVSAMVARTLTAAKASMMPPVLRMESASAPACICSTMRAV